MVTVAAELARKHLPKYDMVRNAHSPALRFFQLFCGNELEIVLGKRSGTAAEPALSSAKGTESRPCATCLL